MPWINAFAIGSCSVEVYRASGEEGLPILIPEGDYVAEGITVEVSETGVVTFSAPDIGSSGYRYHVRVVPSFNTTQRRARLVDAVALDENPDFRIPIWSAGEFEDTPTYPFEFTPAGAAWTWAGWSAGRFGA
ncbi:hypothetical protein ASD78_12245 [Lysobacter sp. Root667]|uniref:hypothetical protein n=1 Tax=Lysobacter sp. Root667 TaxID=1736581 RepID=UPI000700B46D|nr:hypothetical protein [Lysobacter sp. Root667]KRA74257.1 hypothetical protein ASD78_12245 [Lysobacter sp. Root667]